MIPVAASNGIDISAPVTAKGGFSVDVVGVVVGGVDSVGGGGGKCLFVIVQAISAPGTGVNTNPDPNACPVGNSGWVTSALFSQDI